MREPIFFHNIDAIAKDLFQDTWITAMEEIRDFQMGENWDNPECEKVVLFWLDSIANNKLLKRKKEEKREKEILNGDYKYFLRIESTKGSIGKRNYKPTYDKAKLDVTWEKFNPMSREILLFCAADDTLSEDNKKHLPDEKISYLKEKYAVTPSAIRKAKERAIKALELCKIPK